MKRTGLRHLPVIASLLLSPLFACGGAQKQDASGPNSPSAAAQIVGESAPPRPSQQDTNQSSPGASPPAPPQGLDVPQSKQADPFPSQARIQSKRAANVDEGFQRIERAGNDCTEACKALKSMDHACGELCAAATGADERSLCTRSTDRVRRARDTVKRVCGSCPGGTSVEPSDPVPSR